MSPFRSLINRDTVNKPSGKTVSPQSVVVSSITSTTNTTVTQVDTKQQHADEEDRKACGEPHRRGYISTIDVAAKDGVTITTTFCGNAAGRPLQLTKNRVHTRPLLVGVTSPCGNVEFRSLRRKSWLSAPNFPQRTASYLFVVGKCKTEEENSRIEAEMAEHADVVQFSFADLYENLALKSASLFAFAEVFQRPPPAPPVFVLKVEDYMNMSFADVTRVISDLRPAEPYYGSGMIFFHGKVLRSGRWGCPPRHCPYARYPTRYGGGMYLLSPAAVRLVAPALASLDAADPYPVEDHFLATYLHEHGVDVTREKLLWWKGGQPYNPPHTTRDHFLLQRFPGGPAF